MKRATVFPVQNSVRPMFERQVFGGSEPPSLRREWLVRWLGTIAGLSLGSLAQAQGAGDENSAISPVETWLFLDNHLGRLKPPVQLHYVFKSEGSLSPTEDMALALTLTANKRRVSATLQTPRGPVPLSVEGKLEANPILPWFLDRDVATMERLTGGQRRHFQRRVRFALAATQTLVSVNALYANATLPAQQVTLQPYLDDPQRSRFLKLASKRYVLTLATGVPGHVLELQTVIPGPNDDFSQPLQTDTLRLLRMT